MRTFLLYLFAIAPAAATPITLGGGSFGAMPTRTWSAGNVQRGAWFDVDAPTAVHRVVAPASTTTLTVQDRSIRREVGDTTLPDFDWPYRPRPATQLVTRTSSDTGVIAPDPSDPAKWIAVADGVATLTITNGVRTVSRSVTVAAGGGATTDTFLGFAAGSLAKHISDTVDNALFGKSATSALRLFSTYDAWAPNLARNASAWTQTIADVTPISPSNSTAGNLWAGILVSPRHVIFCAHAGVSIGTVMRFVQADGTVVARTLTNKTGLDGYVNYYPDIVVGVLESDVPSGIGFARVLPDDWTSKLPTLSQPPYLPALTLDQEEKALVTDLANVTSNGGTYGAMVTFAQPTNAKRLEFYEPKVGGDSGNPACLIINGHLVLTNVWTFGGAGSGTSIVHFKSAINAKMTALGGGYQLTEVDLSGFPSY